MTDALSKMNIKKLSVWETLFVFQIIYAKYPENNISETVGVLST